MLKMLEEFNFKFAKIAKVLHSSKSKYNVYLLFCKKPDYWYNSQPSGPHQVFSSLHTIVHVIENKIFNILKSLDPFFLSKAVVYLATVRFHHVVPRATSLHSQMLYFYQETSSSLIGVRQA